jgi:hypothetical protein
VAHASVQSFFNNAFIGLPCPKKIAGIVVPMLVYLAVLFDGIVLEAPALINRA